MFIDFLFFTMVGCVLGMFTGITPGIHVNTISMLLLTFVNVINPYYIAIMIIAMSITHTFFDFIPSIMLGAPEPETSLSVLPGHQMLLEGRALEAIYLTIIGGIFGIFFVMCSFPLFLIIIPYLYSYAQQYMGWLLFGITIFMIFTERHPKRMFASVLVFLLSGIIGIIAFNTYNMSITMLFFPLFTGFFGVSMLLFSLRGNVCIPPQVNTIVPIPKRIGVIGSLKGVFAGALMAVLPAVGATQATIITQEITRRRDRREFLVSIGTINTIVALFSLLSLYTISKARSGSAVVIDKILPYFEYKEVVLLIAVAFISAGISSYVLLALSKRLVNITQRINYRNITVFIILTLTLLVIFTTGLYGLLFFIVSISTGLFGLTQGIKRTMCMGVLMLPLMIHYLIL